MEGIDALKAIVDEVPQWHVLLDDLNDKIAHQQLDSSNVGRQAASPRTPKKSASTESLRPNDGLHATRHGDVAGKENNGCEQLYQRDRQGDRNSTGRRPNLPLTPPTSKEQIRPRSSNFSSNPAPLRHAQQQRYPEQRMSHPAPVTRTQTKQNPYAAQIESKNPAKVYNAPSIISVESQQAKMRSRRMLVVYYDSAVQVAFEALVKHISTSRNRMRKGKMAARMAEMRRAAERELDDDSDDGDRNLTSPHRLSSVTRSKTAPSKLASPGPGGMRPFAGIGGDSRGEIIEADTASNGPDGILIADDDDDKTDTELELPSLTFVSTRKMAQTRDGSGEVVVRSPSIQTPRSTTRTGPPGMPLLRKASDLDRIPSGKAKPAVKSNIFDDLDAGLEWCQSMCEQAAHQFLRDGECSLEIGNIKCRLSDVSMGASKALEGIPPAEELNEQNQSQKQESEELRDKSRSQPNLPTTAGPGEFKHNGVRVPHSHIADVDHILEVDDMEVDDDDDVDMAPAWVPTRQRYGRNI